MVKKLKWNLVLMSALYLGLGVFLLMKPTLPPCIPLPNEGREKLSLQRKGT